MPKRYSGEYKQAAIQDCQNGIPIDEVSQTRGIAVSTIYRWLKDCAEEIPNPHYSALLRKKGASGACIGSNSFIRPYR